MRAKNRLFKNGPTINLNSTKGPKWSHDHQKICFGIFGGFLGAKNAPARQNFGFIKEFLTAKKSNFLRGLDRYSNQQETSKTPKK